MVAFSLEIKKLPLIRPYYFIKGSSLILDTWCR
uniref:Uncharacterized protein n=1 Tax=Siphoviridae sp. ctyU16 TaxID=2827976 RepID=A0A8S5TNX1_9CAUD|nr:MAG TPA: hypothetical protein [Siphoviridae sp. ctyU16]